MQPCPMMTAGLLLFVPSLRPRRRAIAAGTTGHLVRDVYTSPPLRIYVSPLTSICLREFHLWNSAVPPMEFASSTTGTREFHCWNSNL